MYGCMPSKFKGGGFHLLTLPWWQAPILTSRSNMLFCFLLCLNLHWRWTDVWLCSSICCDTNARNGCKCLLRGANIVTIWRVRKYYSCICLVFHRRELFWKNLLNMNEYILMQLVSFGLISAIKGSCIWLWESQRKAETVPWFGQSCPWPWTSEILSAWLMINRTFWSSSFWLTQRARLD